MNNFEFSRATDVADAVRQIAADPGARFVAGGTNLIDLIKEGVTKPSRLIDITRLQLNRIEDILGASERCIATHPSDMCVALAALEARVLTAGRNGERSIALADFHRLPGDTPQIDTNLGKDEIITGVELPPGGFAENYSYLKIRDRLSYAFALVSVAAALEIENGVIRQARLALGGVAHKPWRDQRAEAQLSDAPATRESFARAAETVLRQARGFGHNDFKIELARRAILRALSQAASGTPQSQVDKRVR
jgi:xanthine dehydrogenase YagS FAD-binding subunit